MTDNRIANAYKNINISPEAEARIWQELAEENAKHGEKRRRSLWWGVSAALITAAAVFVAAILPGRLEKPAEEPETPLASPVENTPMPPLPEKNEMFAQTLALYERAVKERWDAETLNSNGLPSILSYGYNSDGTTSIGYAFADLDGDGRNEMITGLLADSENAEYYDKLIFAVYAQNDDGSIITCFESQEKDLNFWVGGDRFATETYGPDGMPVQITRRFEDNELVDMTYVTDRADYQRFELVSFTTGDIVPPTLMSVLDGAEFYFAAEERYMTIGMSAEAFGISLDHNDSVRIGVYRYCLCDLDADGTDELIMEVSNNGSDDILGYIIVRTERNRFVGYVSFYRGFYDLKTDGTYSYANSASCSGTGRAQFTDTVMLTDDLAHTEPRRDDNGNILEQGYFIGADRVTDTEYWAFIDTQDAKENVYWLDINDAAYVRMG